MRTLASMLVLSSIAAVGCGATSSSPDAGSAPDAATSPDAPGTDAFVAPGDAFTPNDTGPAAITADAIRAALGSGCNVVGGMYAPDEGDPETISICQGPGSVLFWNSDIDVDCDGGRTQTCMVDPAYQPDTSTTGADGIAIDAETVPFVVIPLPSARFRYADHGIDLGQLALVTYQDRWAIGVFADEGPNGIIGEASYAMNVLLGVDPDPVTGGADSGATFVIFTGTSARIADASDHDAAIAAAMPLVSALVGH